MNTVVLVILTQIFCGMGRDIKVAGGRRAAEKEFPWAVSVQIKKHYHHVGGSLLSMLHLMTTCRGLMSVKITIKMITIQAGDNMIWSVHDVFSKHIQFRESRNWFTHPRCRRPRGMAPWENDVGLVRVDKPFVLTDYVKPLPISREAPDEWEAMKETLRNELPFTRKPPTQPSKTTESIATTTTNSTNTTTVTSQKSTSITTTTPTTKAASTRLPKKLLGSTISTTKQITDTAGTTEPTKPTGNQTNEVICQAMGWGYETINADGEYSGEVKRLRTVDLKLMSNLNCARILCKTYSQYCQIVRYDKERLEDRFQNMVCAHAAVNTSQDNICEGDFGGSLLCDGTVIAMPVWAPYCGHWGLPSLHISIAYPWDWLSSIAKELPALKAGQTTPSSFTKSSNTTLKPATHFIRWLVLLMYSKNLISY